MPNLDGIKRELFCTEHILWDWCMYNTTQMKWKEIAQLSSFHICCTKWSVDFHHHSLVLSFCLETM